MTRPELEGIVRWISPELVESVEGRRRQRGEVSRNRKLDTRVMLWLMLVVSLNTAQNSLHAILRTVAASLDMDWEVSTAAFCKARARFFPQASTFSARQARAQALSPSR